MATENGFVAKIQVFEPHRAKLPPVIPYIKEFWRRRSFAIELSKFADKAEYLGSKLGKVWLVLNPLLLAFVYFLLVSVIRGGHGHNGINTLLHILIGLFTFYFAQNCISAGAQSITSGGRLILNQAFPRALLPFSSTISAFQQFLPTLPVYIGILILVKLFSPGTEIHSFSLNLLWVPLLIALVGITGFGLALLFATMNVYFRDTNKLLSYVLRIWLYLSPVLWVPDMLHGKQQLAIYLNPLGPVLSANSEVWIRGEAPTLSYLLTAIAWAFGSLIVGGYFFSSRERDFAVRI
jgi:teichoic acid transport system permease protein